MQALFLFLIGLYIVYALFAVRVGARLWRERRTAFDDHFTAHDRQLVGAATFYLLTPIAVAVHELGHAAVTWALGGYIAKWGYIFYAGYVTAVRQPPFTPIEYAWIAAAGNLVTLAMAAGAIVWTVRGPANAAWNFVRLELARILLWITLVFYPIVSLLFQFGDFHIIRHDLDQVAPHLGDGVLAAYTVIALLVWYRWRGPWRARFAWLTSPLYDRLRAATRKLEQDPSDVRALTELGRTLLVGSQPGRALGPLERAAELRPDDPEIRYLAGTARLALGHARKASEHLRAAGTRLEEMAEAGQDSELRFEVTLALAGTRLALGDVEGALMTAEAARDLRPLDARVLLVHADALIAAGRGNEARGKLEAALEGAQGAFAHEIRRRLDGLAD